MPRDENLDTPDFATTPLTDEERDDAAPSTAAQVEPETAATPEDSAPVVEDPDVQIVLDPDFKVPGEDGQPVAPEDVFVSVPGLDPDADYVEDGRVAVSDKALTVPQSVALALSDSAAVKIEETD